MQELSGSVIYDHSGSGKTRFSTKICVRKFSATELLLLILCLNGKEVTWIYYDIDNKKKALTKI